MGKDRTRVALLDTMIIGEEARENMKKFAEIMNQINEDINLAGQTIAADGQKIDNVNKR